MTVAKRESIAGLVQAGDEPFHNHSPSSNLVLGHSHHLATAETVNLFAHLKIIYYFHFHKAQGHLLMKNYLMEAEKVNAIAIYVPAHFSLLPRTIYGHKTSKRVSVGL